MKEIEALENELEKRATRRQKKKKTKMKVTGRSVFGLQKIIAGKRKK